MNNVYLVGFMGTGKTAVGRELAKRKKWRFVDLDDLIELRQKQTITNIFAKKGEPYFRKVEKDTLKEIAKEKKFVVACGGGIVIDEENIKIMKDTGVMICLTAKPEVILKRTLSATHRPLLNVPNPKETVGLLLKMRSPFYALAHKSIDTSRLKIEEVVEKTYKLAAQAEKSSSKKPKK